MTLSEQIAFWGKVWGAAIEELEAENEKRMLYGAELAQERNDLKKENEALRIDIAILEANWDGAIRRTGAQDA